MDVLRNFVEYKNWGLNALTISAIGTAIFSILQGYGSVKQAQIIWSEKSAKAVSIHLFSFNCCYFLMFFLYGLYKNSLASILNGLLIIPFGIIVIGIWKFKKISAKEKLMIAVYSLQIPAMLFLPQKDLVVTAGLIGIAIFITIQLLEIVSLKSFGALSIRYILIFLATNIFWLFYAITINNFPLTLFNSIYVALYAIAIVLYFKYRKNR